MCATGAKTGAINARIFETGGKTALTGATHRTTWGSGADRYR
jgi:hypothetical protein